MIEEGKANVFDKPKDQRGLAHFGLARKGRMKANVFDKPKAKESLLTLAWR